jgi:putative iron-dependent peroxidase
MLENMFVGKPPGNYDRLLDFSRAVTGCLFFVPAASFLDDVTADTAPSPVADDSEATAARPRASLGDGSLGIGSLRKEAGHE